MRRVFALFLRSTSPMGNDRPPVISLKVTLLALGFPLMAALSAASGHTDLLTWYALLTLSGIYDMLTCYQRFLEGERCGRDEMTDEMWLAWTERDMHPGDYLLRETWFAGEEKSAARQVRRPVKAPHPPSSPTDDI